MIPDILKVSARNLVGRITPSVVPSRRLPWVSLGGLHEEARSFLQFRISKLREVKLEPSAYNILVNTPEFSRFVFIVPSTVLFGMAAISFAGPATLPLIYEKMIPYHIKTIAVSSAFYAFTDVAANVLGRPTVTSHHWWKRYLFLAYGLSALVGSTAVMILGDYDPHEGYASSMALLTLNGIPAVFFPLDAWIRFWRLLFTGIGFISAIGAQRKLKYLESNWDDVVFGFS